MCTLLWLWGNCGLLHILDGPPFLLLDGNSLPPLPCWRRLQRLVYSIENARNPDVSVIFGTLCASVPWRYNAGRGRRCDSVCPHARTASPPHITEKEGG